jgi:hypothetical protein
MEMLEVFLSPDPKIPVSELHAHRKMLKKDRNRIVFGLILLPLSYFI